MRLEGRTVSSEEMQFAAVENDEVWGRMSIDTAEGGWHITDIYVDPAHRRQGVGTFMVQHIVNTFDEGGVFMPIEAAYGFDGAGEDLGGFFKGQGNFAVEASDMVVRVSPDQRAQSPAYQSLKKRNRENAKLFFDLESGMRKSFLNHLVHTGEIIFLDDLGEKNYDRNLCYATIRDNAINTAAFVKKHSENEYELAYLYVKNQDALGLSELLSATVYAFEKEHKDADLFFTIVNENVEKLVESIFGENVTSTRGMVARWNGLPVA